MKKILLLAFLLCACGKHAESSQVKLEDGTPGLLVHCNGLLDEVCVAQVCNHRGHGKILHRNVGNNPDSLLVSCQ